MSRLLMYPDGECKLSFAVPGGSHGVGEEQVRHRVHFRRGGGAQPHQHPPSGQLGYTIEVRAQRAEHRNLSPGT